MIGALLIELLVDMGYVESHIGEGVSANFNARWVHSLHRIYHRLENHF
jgi:hypothetical protein